MAFSSPRKLPRQKSSLRVAQPIEPTKIYPCPCCHQGQLRLITLTEAFGCSRCQHIFAITPDRLHIEQLAVSYPYRKMWFWNGHQWVLRRENALQGSTLLGLTFSLGVVLVVGFIGAVLFPSQTQLLSWFLILGLLLTLLMATAILLLRRP
ncbi:hypothetical protein NW851_10435 [Synechococcus sp. H55.7]|uniref:hypothetical protein n=1 Tax=unclassified Synechococcus TaxID=2626047 RepID=UPI0039C45D26